MRVDDSFHELIVKAYRKPQDGIKMLGLSFAALLLIFASFVFSPFLGILMPVLWLGIGYGLIYLLRGFSREFEYSLTNGDLDIDLIIAQRRRRRVFSGTARKFESVRRYEPGDGTGGSLFVLDCRGSQPKRDANSRVQDYQIVAEYQGKRTLVLLTPDEAMLNQFKKFNPSRVIIA